MAMRLDPAKELAAEFSRLVEGSISDIEAHLGRALDGDASGFHDARKTIKKLRALIRLVRSVSPSLLRLNERLLRDAARAVAGPRAAVAAVETIDRLIAAYPRKIDTCALLEIRAALGERQDRIAAADMQASVTSAIGTVREARDGLRSVSFDGDDAGILAEGSRRTLAHWKDALKRARSRGSPDDFHALRKAVKAHWAQLGLLRDFKLGFSAKDRAKVEALGETLGELNDIHEMREALAYGAFDLPEDIDLSPFDRLLKTSAKTLEKQTLKTAARMVKGRKAGLKRRLAKAKAA
ncbi:CHAD domain-containing protein [Mesorhizobium sp. CAU 1732]|uniref:CHAD domain-containing protein n=1 Tax=Mesorhizobium sp. CAU 1732 TaxID=3140358 RepID=UPI003261BABD